MTPQEAIDIIKDPNRHYKAKADGAYEYKEFVEALEMAKQALEYRVAKIVETIVSNEDVKLGAMTMKAGTKVFKCTNCNSYVSPSHKFCTECGQALKWSEDT